MAIWPCVALAIICAAYAGAGPGVYRKHDGRIAWSARFVLWPVLLGQYASLVYYRRHCRPWDEVAPGLLVGRTLTNAEAKSAVDAGVTAVLDLTAAFAEAAPLRASNYRNIPILDLTAPTPGQLREAVAFVRDQAEAGTIFVHCKIGYSRSVAVAAAFLLATGKANTAEDAVDRVRAARPQAIVRPEVLEALEGPW